MAGLFAPAGGGGARSPRALDLDAIQSVSFTGADARKLVPLPGRTIPLKLTGCARRRGGRPPPTPTAAPRIVAVLQAAAGAAPTTVSPAGGETVFHFTSGQWQCNLGYARPRAGNLRRPDPGSGTAGSWRPPSCSTRAAGGGSGCIGRGRRASAARRRQALGAGRAAIAPPPAGRPRGHARLPRRCPRRMRGGRAAAALGLRHWRAPPAQASTPPTAPAPQPGSTPVLTPPGASRAMEAIGKNEQMRRLFMRRQPLGLSPEQEDRRAA